MMVTFACVRTGSKYSVDYVHRLRSMVAAHFPRPHRFVCLTDDPAALPDYETVEVSKELPGWWGKLKLFSTEWREGRRVVYLDLDSVVVNDLRPLADLDVDFGICQSFTQLAGHPTWPCKYGSCVMTFAPDWGGDVWRRFQADRESIMAQCGKYGDQKAIEMLVPNAKLLQPLLPQGYFLGYRHLALHPEGAPKETAIVVFAGSHKPHNCALPWLRQAWAA